MPSARVPCNNSIVPVTCGTSYRNKGVQKLLDAIVDYMPAPVDVPHIKGVNPETGEEEERPSTDNAPFAALAFKIATDPYVGKLGFFRVYSGTVDAGTTVYNSNKDDNERIGRILQMHANHRKDIDTCYAGDIAAAVGLKNTTTGDTLCDPKASDHSGVDGVPGAGYPCCHRAQDQGWSGEDGQSLWRSWLKRTPPSRPTPMRKPVRPLSLVWVSCIWKSSLTVCCVNSR